jgi:4'-phosphopantetheinyl transferase
VDIEEIDERRIGSLSGTVLDRTETMRCGADFFTYWCRKESVVKATGEGLRVPLSTVLVSPADGPARLRSYRGAPLPAAMVDVEVGDGYRGAVTVLTGQPTDQELSVRSRPAGTLLPAAR